MSVFINLLKGDFLHRHLAHIRPWRGTHKTHKEKVLALSMCSTSTIYFTQSILTNLGSC